jgi:Icc-related predicted phosphoesterase
MKVLLVSDLHSDHTKLDWVAMNAEQFDVVAVAGDLLNIFVHEDSSAQQKRILRWKGRVLKSGCSLAWCSGNHDFFHGEDSPIIAASPDWMTGADERFVGDGETRLLTSKSGTLAITTSPWPVTGSDVVSDGRRVPFIEHVERLLKAGKVLQKDHPWLVLAHEPPVSTVLAVDYFANEARFTRMLIERWQPDWSHHGHIHESATVPGGKFFERVGETTCFNAGQSLDEEEPHYIALNVCGDSWNAHWSSSDRSAALAGVLSR